MTLERDVADGVHRIEDAHVNWYLLEEAGGTGVTVVDTGHPRSWDSLKSALRDLGRSLSDVRAVVLTHGHFDHMGFAERARQELGVPVLAHVQEVPVVRRPWHYDHERTRLIYPLRHPSFIGVFAAMGAAGALTVKGCPEPTTYEADERLDVPGRPRVLFTPGHTYGHCSLLLEDRDAVIAGDALVTFNPYTGGAGPQIVAGAATADSGRSLASLDVLAATGVSRVLPGHGPVWRDGVADAARIAREHGPS